jgi:uncharacterized protein
MTGERPVVFVAGGLRLEGKLTLCSGLRHAAVLCHPHPQFGGSMDNNVVLAAAEGLHSVAVATLRFNFRGVGASEGRYGDAIGEVEDACAAVGFVRAQTGLERIAVIGYSFGAAVGLRAGCDAPDVDRLVAIAPPVSMFDISFLRGCAKPLLFIVGTGDPFCAEEDLERSARELTPRAEIVRLSGADHFFFGHEERLSECCARFFRQPSSLDSGQE